MARKEADFTIRRMAEGGGSRRRDDDVVPSGLDAAHARQAYRRDGSPTEPSEADPLAEKHRAKFDKDFRTVDYSNLSGKEAKIARRKKASRSSWQYAPEEARAAQPSSFGAYTAKFAFFGGSVIAADFVRLEEGGKDEERQRCASREPAPLGAPHPDGRTPARDARKHLKDDPLAAKHKPVAADFSGIGGKD